MPAPAGSLDGAYKALAAAFTNASRDEQDGLRLAWSDRWLHVSPSGTEPVVRLIAEAPSEAEARKLVAEARRVLGG